MARTKRTKAPLSSSDSEKRRKRMVAGFGVFMVLLMVASIAGVIEYNPSSTTRMTYGDHTFSLEQRADGSSILVTQLNGQRVEFQNLPVQVGTLSVDPAAVTLLREAKQVALVADPSMGVEDAGIVDYARLQLALAIPSSVSAISHADPRYRLPVLDCAQASAQMPVVLFQIANGTNASAGVTTQGYCVLVRGGQQDILNLKDRLIFEYYGILNNGQVADG